VDDSYTLLVYKLPVPFVLLDPVGQPQSWSKIRMVRFDTPTESGSTDSACSFSSVGRARRARPAEEDVKEEVTRLEKYLHKVLPEGVTVPVRGIAFLQVIWWMPGRRSSCSCHASE
jgi:hypothetical protein